MTEKKAASASMEYAGRAGRQLRPVAGALAVAWLPGCSGVQSALDPQGPAASTIAGIAWILFGGAGVIFALVLSLLVYALWRDPAKRAALNTNAFIIGGGVVLPVVTLSALLVHAFFAGAELEAEPDDPLTVEVTAHQWWWEFAYLEPGSHDTVVTANELHIPAGRPVKLRLESADVIHTFWVPNLAGKRDMIPGHTNTLLIEADHSGLFRGQCNEFCGAQHALMSLHVVSEPPGQFEQWLARQREPARQPDDPFLQQGRDAFMSSGCPVCHTVRGTQARGRVGPDLTHFGGRRSIAAVTMKNTLGNRQAWIMHSQHIKPGNHMPDHPLEGETLRAMAAWLGSLE